MNVFKSIWNFLRGKLVLVFRMGMDKFFDKYMELAVNILTNLAKVNSEVSFDKWKADARLALMARLKADGQDIKDNWVELLLGFAFEHIKAKGIVK